LVWCPSSNLFMLGRTLEARVLRSGLPLALGSDSALTADGDLLDELQAARRSVDCGRLYRMVTDGPRSLLRLPAIPGDVVLFRDSGLDPAETLLDAGRPDLVVVRGRIRLASAGFAERLPRGLVGRMFRFLVDGREMLCDVDIGRLGRETAAILGPEFRLAGKRVSACM
jgi:cytosine/adenosine deaminase-related metal-dependent hydrolase